MDQSEAHACSSAAPIPSCAYGLSATDAGCFSRDGGGLNTVLVKGVGVVTFPLRDTIDGDGIVFEVSLAIPMGNTAGFGHADGIPERTEFAFVGVRSGWVAERMEVLANVGSFSLSAVGDWLLSVAPLPDGLRLS